MKTLRTNINILFILVFIFLSTAFAQWSTDPSVNLAVCDAAGDQALAKIVSTSDGGCYISWFDTRSGDYHVYLQRLDPAGYELWAHNGLLISDNPNFTFIVDYDLIVDHNDNAVLAFCDSRNSGNLNVFAYLISPEGNFLWGSDGISLSTSTDFQAAPKITETTNGNFVFSWIVDADQTQIANQKISPDGTKLWGTEPILIQSASEGYSYPDVVSSDNDAVIVVHTTVTGTFPAQTVKLRATKLDANGLFEWGTGGVMLQNLGTISSFSVPEVYSDNMNGALAAWHDDRDFNNLQSGFVQRVSSSGSIYFPENGAELSLKANRHKFNPVAAFDPVTEQTYAFWMETDANQNQNGISGQLISPTGERLWGDNAKIFKDLSAPFTASISYLNALMGNGAANLFYLAGNGSGLNQTVEGFACDANGDFIWSGDIVTLSNSTQDKLQLASSVDNNFNCNLAWGDMRSSNHDIYAQDINKFGELGNPIVPVELQSFTATVTRNSVSLNWQTATETNNSGFEIERSEMSNVNSQTDWQVIGFIPGFGTTTEPKSYSFVDENLSSGKYQYRLKQIDFDGSFEYSNIVEVEINSPTEFSLEQNYPNPFNPSTTIGFSIPERSFVTLKVYDMLGREVEVLISEQKESGNYQIGFNASDLSSGIYYYTLTTGNFTSTKKMSLVK